MTSLIEMFPCVREDMKVKIGLTHRQTDKTDAHNYTLTARTGRLLNDFGGSRWLRHIETSEPPKSIVNVKDVF